MPGFAYPFVYECGNCDYETTVERSDAHELYPVNSDSLKALEVVLEERGWIRPNDGGLLCPDCAKTEESPSSGVDVSNPYDEEEEPDLHRAWADGYRAGQADSPVPSGRLYNQDRKSSAWVDGYTAAKLELDIG